ncbi:MAG: hydroxymethylbilane synthase [Coriobacteriaceae bacterium]|nr:hydroxymethylbilane synthase [Coriobacteriaceae bacterium]
MSRILVIGTRGSALALWQAHAVQDALQAARPELRTEIRVISTKGDRILDKPLEQIGDKGLFTKELEGALLAGEVDVCVHSMKDVPSELPAGCLIDAMLPRADVRDVLVCGPRIAGSTCLADVPAGARLGTGSLRRVAQLRARYPHIQPAPIRGNVDTRLAKAQGDDYEGAILAAAGVLRMGCADAVAAYLPVDEMVPAVGQGAIGIEVLEGNDFARAAIACVNDAATFACVQAERRILAALEGGCQVPVGAHFRQAEDGLRCDAIVLALDGSRQARVSRCDAADADPLAIADAVVAELRAQGADGILAEIRPMLDAKAGGSR